MVKFEPMRNQWYMHINIKGHCTRAYLDVYFESNKEEAFTRAVEIFGVLSNEPEISKEIPSGYLFSTIKDFKSFI